MRFKAVLVGALVRPFGKGDPIPWQVFTQTQDEAEKLGQQVLEGLSQMDQKTAQLHIEEVKTVLLAEIHVAAVQPVDKDGKRVGPLVFAIARHNEQIARA